MTVHHRDRSVPGAAGVPLAAAFLLGLLASGCSTAGTQTDTASTQSSASADAGAPPAPAPEPSTPAPEVTVPEGVVGKGCSNYVVQVPAGPGSIGGMVRDPVATALSNSPVLTTIAGALTGTLNPEVTMADTLNKGQYTVFAPIDDAFLKVDPPIIEKLKTDPDQLTAVLNYQVVPGELDPTAVIGEHKTRQGQTLNVTSTADGLKVNDTAVVVCGGIKTANAMVYLTDTVLFPPAPAAPPPASGAPGTDGSTAPEAGDGTEATSAPPTP